MRVVITGIGAVTSIGIGKEKFFDSLFEKKINLTRTEGIRSKSQWYSPFPKAEVAEEAAKLRALKGKAPLNASAAVLSALQAVKDAGIDPEELDRDTAVTVGCGIANMNEFYGMIGSVVQSKRMFPLAITQVIPNSAAAWISIILGTHGKAQTVGTACASGTSAIGDAYRAIKDGYVKTAIAGGAECLAGDNFASFMGFSAIDALTKADDGIPAPFCEERSGFLFSEGASCMLVLEELETALARGADIYAEIVDHRECSDAYHIVMMPEEPEDIYREMDGIFSSYKVDYYNAHGTATAMNDSMEAKMLAHFEEKYGQRPIVSSTKGILGHTLGASGAIEAAVCAYSLRNSVVHGNLIKTKGFGIDLPEATVSRDIRTAVSASFGFGGHDAMLVMKKFEI